MKLSIKKGHIVLGALVLALGAAVYLNWDYMKQTDYVAAGNTNQTTNENEGTANYGDAYFVSARLSRTQSRDEAMDALTFWRIEASGSCLPANTGCCRSGFRKGLSTRSV